MGESKWKTMRCTCGALVYHLPGRRDEPVNEDGSTHTCAPTDALVEDLKKAMDALKDARLKWDPEGSAYTLEEAAYGHALAAVSEAMTALARLRSIGEPDGERLRVDPGMLAFLRATQNRVGPDAVTVTVMTPTDEPEEGEDEG